MEIHGTFGLIVTVLIIQLSLYEALKGLISLVNQYHESPMNWPEVYMSLSSHTGIDVQMHVSLVAKSSDALRLHVVFVIH